MLYLIGFICISAGFISPRSKRVYVFQLAALSLIMGGNTANPDYVNYKFMYENGLLIIENEGIKNLFYLLPNMAANYFGLSFQGFYFLFMFVSLLALGHVIGLYTAKRNQVLSLFTVYPMAESTIQIRTFFAVILLLWGIKFLIDTADKNGILKYLFFVFLATGFHISFVFYYIFVLLRFFKIKDNIALVQIGTTMLCLILPFMPYLFTVLMGSEDTYFSTVSRLSVIKVIIMCCWQLAGVILLNLICKAESIDVPIGKDFFKFVKKMNIAVCLVLPMYFGGTTFMRLYRNIFILNYIAVVSKKTNLYKYVYYLYILATVGFFYILAEGGYAFTQIIQPIFQNNIIYTFKF